MNEMAEHQMSGPVFIATQRDVLIERVDEGRLIEFNMKVVIFKWGAVFSRMFAH